ncbi:hypothetical protein DASC09_032750 [Saccharomycopsis crataegensis]|uniref:Rho-GAP domain-containing protein n=1 Tax=Saccharomycopsis crataegensis TaxID=43959 RepID=A0AAV5QLV8_9ASCO|nr:hypothetical protein DASC09_032750 [Saccharomycopsis crataegensis]
MTSSSALPTSKRTSFFGNYRDTKSLRSNNKLKRNSLSKSSNGVTPSKSEPNDESSINQSIRTTTLFGSSLVDAQKLSASHFTVEYQDDYFLSLVIPSIVNNSIDYLNKNNCLDKEGVFRVGGNLKRIKGLQETFNHNPSFDYSPEETKELNVYDVATLLKRYLNALPDSIVPSDVSREIKQELENVGYKDLLIFSQSANESISFKIDCLNDVTSTADTDLKLSKSRESSELDSFDDSRKNRAVLVVDVDPEKDQPSPEYGPGPSGAKSVSVVDNNDASKKGTSADKIDTPHSSPIIHNRKRSLNSNDALLKNINTGRPMPLNFRKHSLMSVLSLSDSAADSRSMNSTTGNNINRYSNIPDTKELPESVKSAVYNFLDFFIPVLVNDLNTVNLDLLIFMLRFLSLLSANFEKTKMNSFNLSKIFQTCFFLNVQLSGNIDILNGGSNGTSPGVSNPNRLSVSINANQTYQVANPNNKLQPTFTRNSIISTNSGFSGLASRFYNNPDNGTSTSVNNNNLTVQTGPEHDNFSLESFNSVNVDYNVNQLVLKILIDNYAILMDNLFKYIVLDNATVNQRLFKTNEEIEKSDPLNFYSSSLMDATGGSKSPNGGQSFSGTGIHSIPPLKDPSVIQKNNPTNINTKANGNFNSNKSRFAKGEGSHSHKARRFINSPISEKSHFNSNSLNSSMSSDNSAKEFNMVDLGSSNVRSDDATTQREIDNDDSSKGKGGKKKKKSIFSFLSKKSKKKAMKRNGDFNFTKAEEESQRAGEQQESNQEQLNNEVEPYNNNNMKNPMLEEPPKIIIRPSTANEEEVSSTKEVVPNTLKSEKIESETEVKYQELSDQKSQIEPVNEGNDTLEIKKTNNADDTIVISNKADDTIEVAQYEELSANDGKENNSKDVLTNVEEKIDQDQLTSAKPVTTSSEDSIKTEDNGGKIENEKPNKKDEAESAAGSPIKVRGEASTELSTQSLNIEAPQHDSCSNIIEVPPALAEPSGLPDSNDGQKYTSSASAPPPDLPETSEMSLNKPSSNNTINSIKHQIQKSNATLSEASIVQQELMIKSDHDQLNDLQSPIQEVAEEHEQDLAKIPVSAKIVSATGSIKSPTVPSQPVSSANGIIAKDQNKMLKRKTSMASFFRSRKSSVDTESFSKPRKTMSLNFSRSNSTLGNNFQAHGSDASLSSSSVKLNELQTKDQLTNPSGIVTKRGFSSLFKRHGEKSKVVGSSDA